MSTTLLAFAVLVLSSSFRANAQLNPNYSYVGGIPLRTPGKCPAGSVSGQITFEQNCCGADQTFVKVEGSVCCPDGTDCYNEVVAAPKCADPSWQLCGKNQGGFCCQENWVCWTQSVSGITGGGVGCSTPGATLTKGLQTEVTTVYAANAGPGASTTTSPSAAPLTSSSGPQATSAGKTDSGTQSSPTNASPPTTGSPTSSSPSSSSSSSSGGSSEGSSSGSTTTTKSSSLGGGAIAGIAVGALALLAAAFVGGIWFTRRKNKSDPSTVSMLENFKTPFDAPKTGTTASSRSELQAQVPENGAKATYVPLSELPAHQTQPVEMYAPYKGHLREKIL